jgi:hypothetical protein
MPTNGLNRREMLKMGAVAGAAAAEIIKPV